MRRYVIDITAYEHVATDIIEAETPEEAKRIACERRQISVTVRDTLPALTEREDSA